MGAQGIAGYQGVQGLTGAQGATGATGAVGLTYRGAWSGGTGYSANDAVTLSGSTYLALTSSTNVNPAGDVGHWSLLTAAGATGAQGLQGVQGTTGPTGAAGAAATISVGTVSTGATAAVTNSGTSSAAVFDFTLPSGGTSGGSGGYSTVHTVTGGAGGNLYYSPMSDLKGTTETSSVIGFFGQACKIATISFYTATTNAMIDIRTGTLPTGLALASGLSSCFIMTGQTTSCTGPGSLAANTFMDFKISAGTNSTSYIWSSFVCQ